LCVRFTVASTSPSPVHRRLCCAIRLHKVFVIKLPLPASSLNHARWSHPSRHRRALLTNASTTALLLLCPAQPRCQHHRSWGPLPCMPGIGNTDACFRPRRVVGSGKPSRTSALRRLDCIDFGIDPPVSTSSASIASSPFFYVSDSPDCIEFGIAPSHDDCLDTSPSSPWRPLCACSSIDMATRQQLRRPPPSSAQLLRPRPIAPSCLITSTLAQRATTLHVDSSASSATTYEAHRLL
jgi:hypothetical protein